MFTPNLTTIILSTIGSPNLNYPVSSRFKTLLPMLSSKVPSHVMSPHPTFSPLAQNHWMHQTQTPLTYLQSTHNHPTSPIPSLITLSSFDSPLCSSITPSHFHFWLKTNCFTNTSPCVSLLFPGLPSWTITQTICSELLVFCFSLFFFDFWCCALD